MPSSRRGEALLIAQTRTCRSETPPSCAVRKTVLSLKSPTGAFIAAQTRTFLKPFFMGGDVEENGICSAAFCESAALRVCSLPGGAVAQRLRGYGWRSEKSVKAIAPTGAALAFLCFDFCFRIVKGVQPLARCGVGGVQR